VVRRRPHELFIEKGKKLGSARVVQPPKSKKEARKQKTELEIRREEGGKGVRESSISVRQHKESPSKRKKRRRGRFDGLTRSEKREETPLSAAIN